MQRKNCSTPNCRVCKVKTHKSDLCCKNYAFTQIRLRKKTNRSLQKSRAKTFMTWCSARPWEECSPRTIPNNHHVQSDQKWTRQPCWSKYLRMHKLTMKCSIAKAGVTVSTIYLVNWRTLVLARRSPLPIMICLGSAITNKSFQTLHLILGTARWHHL